MASGPILSLAKWPGSTLYEWRLVVYNGTQAVTMPGPKVAYLAGCGRHSPATILPFTSPSFCVVFVRSRAAWNSFLLSYSSSFLLPGVALSLATYVPI
jgi:hypothetical protein